MRNGRRLPHPHKDDGYTKRESLVKAGEGYYKEFISAPLSGIGSTYFNSIKYLYYRKRKYNISRQLLPNFRELSYNGRIVLERLDVYDKEENPVAGFILSELERRLKLREGTLKARYLLFNNLSHDSHTRVLEWYKKNIDVTDVPTKLVEEVSNSLPEELVELLGKQDQLNQPNPTTSNDEWEEKEIEEQITEDVVEEQEYFETENITVKRTRVIKVQEKADIAALSSKQQKEYKATITSLQKQKENLEKAKQSSTKKDQDNIPFFEKNIAKFEAQLADYTIEKEISEDYETVEPRSVRKVRKTSRPYTRTVKRIIKVKKDMVDSGDLETIFGPITPHAASHIEEVQSLVATLPPLIEGMLDSEFREVRQLAYRFATTPATEGGLRMVHIWFNVFDDGRLNPLVKAQRTSIPINERDRLTIRPHAIGNEHVWLDKEAVEGTLGYAKFYKDQIDKLKKSYANQIGIINESYFKFDDPAIQALGREIEEGPNEYKNYPFYTNVPYKNQVIWNTEKYPLMCPDTETYRRINTNIVPAGHYHRKVQHHDGTIKRVRMTGHSYGESRVPYTVLRLTIGITLPEWKLTPQKAITYPNPDYKEKDCPPVYLSQGDQEEQVYSSMTKQVKREKEVSRRDLKHLKEKDPQKEEILYRQACIKRLAKTFEGTIDAIITMLCVSRQVQAVDKPIEELQNQKGIRDFDTTKYNERQQLKILHQIVDYYISLYNLTNFDSINAIESQHDHFIKIAKEMSSQCRVVWQKAQSKEKLPLPEGKMSLFHFNDIIQNQIELNKLCKMVLNFLSYTNPEFLNDVTLVRFDGEELNLPTYGLCCMGYVGRSLPLCSLAKINEENYNTYNRFREPKQPHAWDSELKGKVRSWAKEYFKDVPNKCKPNGKPYTPKLGASATWERSRSQGGYTAYLSDVWNALKCVSIEKLKELKLEKTAQFFLDNQADIGESLKPGNIQIKADINAKFAYAYASDMLKDYIAHAAVCKREKCTEIEKHLPMYTIGIRELGGKSRVPCITTALLNTITEPIRQKMFVAIKQDKRCSFRLKNIDKVDLIERFLRNMNKSDTIHAGDLTVSTDNFPMWFMEMVGLGMLDAAVIDTNEFNILLLCSGPFAIIEPSEDNESIRRCSKPLPLSDLQNIVRQEVKNKQIEEIERKGKRMLLAQLNKPSKLFPDMKRGIITDEDIMAGRILSDSSKSLNQPQNVDDDKLRDTLKVQNIKHPERIKWAKKPKPACKLVKGKNAYIDNNKFKPHVSGFNEWIVYRDKQPDDEGGWKPNLKSTVCKSCGTPLELNEWHSNKQCNINAIELAQDMEVTRATKGLTPYYKTHSKKIKPGEFFGPPMEGFRQPSDKYADQLEGPDLIFQTKSKIWKEYRETDLYKKGKRYTSTPLDLFDSQEPFDNEAIAEYYISKTKSSWNLEEQGYEGYYLTKKGVQMSTSISIGMLYSYNIFSDTHATVLKPLCKGQSQLCGDDSLRAGDDDYIQGYRDTITALGGIWSTTKDVVGQYPRGVFTELLIENGKIISVPKAKTIIRPDKEDRYEAPAWRRAIPAINSLKAPRLCKGPLVREIIERFPQINENYVPTFLPKELGGIGVYSSCKNSTLKQAWNNVKRIKDPLLASECLREFRRCTSIEKHAQERSIMDIDKVIEEYPPTYVRGPKELLDMEYKLGRSSYAYLEAQRLRGLIESASNLELPPMPTPFRNDKGVVALRVKESIDACYDLMVKHNLDDFSGTQRKDGLYDVVPSDNQYISQTYRVDIATSWVDEIATMAPLTSLKEDLNSRVG